MWREVQLLAVFGRWSIRNLEPAICITAMSINPPVLGLLQGLASPLEAFRVTWPASTVHGRNEVFLAYRPGMKVDMKRPNEGIIGYITLCRNFNSDAGVMHFANGLFYHIMTTTTTSCTPSSDYIAAKHAAQGQVWLTNERIIFLATPAVNHPSGVLFKGLDIPLALIR
jgi:hypothetical protein